MEYILYLFSSVRSLQSIDICGDAKAPVVYKLRPNVSLKP